RRRSWLLGDLHAPGLPGEHVVEGAQRVRLLVPRLHLRSQKRRGGDRWAGSASACGARAEAQGRCRDGCFDLFGPRRRHAKLIRDFSFRPSGRREQDNQVHLGDTWLDVPALRRELKVDGICSSLKGLAIAAWTNSLDPAAEIGRHAGVGRTGRRRLPQSEVTEAAIFSPPPARPPPFAKQKI